MKPTVLIGLGGIGSSTVDRIYGMMSDEQKKLTASAVLDTDIGDLQKLKNIDIAIQTSPDVKVGNYVHRHPETKSWFPDGFKKIDEMMLTDGAGQVRALSRLSFFSAIERGSLAALDRAVEKLSLINDNAYKSDVNVVIVGSIAGGTGSGSFLQMGMYMRRYFATKNPNASVFIQGVFLLPDTLCKTNTIIASEWKNVRFNAYAALKELNAILSPSVMEKINIELEYHPDASSKITYNNRPYDNILFFDYENSNNQHLENFSEYLELLGETIYYGYISPISSDYQSRFVNQIREFILNNQESFYSASSVNKLIYPYADIVDYLSLEWIIDEIDTSWLQFDKNYDEEVSEYKSNLSQGVNTPKPQRDQIYIDSMDRLEKAEKTPFFSTVFKQTRLWDEEKGEIKGTKDEEFVSSIIAHIQNTLEQDNDLELHKEECSIRSNLMEDVDNASKHVRRLEDNRQDFQKEIDDIIQKHKNMLLKEVILQDCNDEHIKSDHAHNINYWLIPNHEAMHPVSTRYFLYKVRAQLQETIDQLDTQSDEIKNFVDDYYKMYNINSPKDTEHVEYYESSVEVITMISQRGGLDKIKDVFTRNTDYDFKEFIDNFHTKYTRQISRINELLSVRLQKAVLEKILISISDMVENWEGLFSMLGKDLLEEIQGERNILMNKHAHRGKDIYLFETPELKKKLWDDVEHELRSEGENSNLATEINKAQYRLFCKQIDPKNRDESLLSKDNYKDLLVTAYKQALQNKLETRLDLDLRDAVYMERRLSNNATSTIQDYVERLKNKNYPWLHTHSEDIVLTKFWGVKEKDITLEGNVTVSDEFPKNELVYLVMYHNLTINNFEKFSVKERHDGSRREGDYFKAYHELMQKIAMNPTKYVTPHIDKRWGTPTYMPDLNADITKEEERNIARAFIVGLVEKNIYIDTQDTESYFIARSPSRSRKIQVQGKSIQGEKYLILYHALASNPVIVGDMLNFYADTVKSELAITPWEIDKDTFLQTNKDAKLLNILIKMLQNEVLNETDYDEVMKLISVYGKVLTDYIYEGFGEIKEDLATKKAQEFKTSLLEASTLEELNNSNQDNVKRSFLA